ncbi:unnamed protein product [Moneuplotes crassus]|uniref:Uncharacterized protein n=1 Tax=Euplotes crassus TaxID=5936 RepID=A0AAD1XZR7_EUPCR|nr:unnamed protein product [Moneuplotes crassus]
MDYIGRIYDGYRYDDESEKKLLMCCLKNPVEFFRKANKKEVHGIAKIIRDFIIKPPQQVMDENCDFSMIDQGEGDAIQEQDEIGAKTYLSEKFKLISAADFENIKKEPIIVDELAKAFYKKIPGDPTLNQIKDMIMKCEKNLIEETLSHEERKQVGSLEVIEKPITYKQALNRQFMKNAQEMGKKQDIYCLDDFLDLPEGELYQVSEKEHRELSEIMKLTLRKNPRLKTYEVDDLVRDDHYHLKDEKCLKSIFLTVKKPIKSVQRPRTCKRKNQQKHVCHRLQRNITRRANLKKKKQVVGGDKRNEKEMTEQLKKDFRTQLKKKKKYLTNNKVIRNHHYYHNMLDRYAKIGDDSHLTEDINNEQEEHQSSEMDRSNIDLASPTANRSFASPFYTKSKAPRIEPDTGTKYARIGSFQKSFGSPEKIESDDISEKSLKKKLKKPRPRDVIPKLKKKNKKKTTKQLMQIRRKFHRSITQDHLNENERPNASLLNPENVPQNEDLSKCNSKSSIAERSDCKTENKKRRPQRASIPLNNEKIDKINILVNIKKNRRYQTKKGLSHTQVHSPKSWHNAMRPSKGCQHPSFAKQSLAFKRSKRRQKSFSKVQKRASFDPNSTKVSSPGGHNEIRDEFREYLRELNIPIVNKRVASPMNFTAPNIQLQNTPSGSAAKQKRLELNHLQMNMLCGALPQFTKITKPVIHRIAMKHLKNEA